MSLCSHRSSLSDPYFLVNFIMSNYLGPHLDSDNPSSCSVSQRLAKGLPLYTSNHVGSSSLTLAQLQNLYYYVLRNAKSSLLLHPDKIHMYLKGCLPIEVSSGELHQFTDYFPTNLHPQKHEIVKGVVVIDDPEVAFISKEELERFRGLSRLDDLRINRVMCLSPLEGTNQDFSRNEQVRLNGLVTNQDKRKKEEEEAVAAHAFSKTPERCRESYKRARFKNGETLMERDKSLQLVCAPPGIKECDAVVTRGTASKVTLGPSIFVVDIGVNKAAYFFQVALPGVCRDSGEFSCEIKSDGKVILEGSTTTGCKTIKRHSRVFKINIRKLSPPGPFKLSFTLPGPVDPRLFSPNFRSDGIFEAVVIRLENSI